MEQNRIPSTDQSTWGAKFNKGDKVRIRIDFSNIADVNNSFTIVKAYSLTDTVRKENPSGIMYDLSNGQSWEGKDLELVSASQTSDNNDMKRDSDTSKDIDSLSSFVEFDTQKDKIIILRVKTPQTGGTPPPPQDEENPPPPEPQPDNIKDPFEETPPPPPDKDEDKGDDKDEDKGDEKGDEKGDDKGDDKGDNKGDEKGDEKGDDEGDDEGDKKDDDKGKGKQNAKGGDKDSSGKGTDSQSKSLDNEGEGADSEFGDDDDELQSIEDLLKKIQEDFESGKSAKDIQIQNDLGIIENALSTPRNQIKNIFKTKLIAKTALGKSNIFGADNEQRINDTLNEIFK